MGSFHENMTEYRNQMQQGKIQHAYKGLMDYILGLRAYFKKKYPDHYVSGSIYYGYMDMTYFSFIPESFKQRDLKVAIVFVHETFRFEAWLAGVNKQVQQKYWKMFKESGFNEYPLLPTTTGVDAIIEHVLVSEPDFSDLAALTERIERQILKFLRDIESYLQGF